MKDETKHLDEKELIEYFYKESPFPERIEGHIKECQRCKGEYLKLKEEMERISENFKKGFWKVQRQVIMSEVEGMQRVKRPLWTKWWKPVFATAVITFLITGLYFRLHHSPVQYTQKDVEEEFFLEGVSELVDQPLTSSLDFLDFQEEEEELYDYTFEKLDLFGYWLELDNMNNVEEKEA